MQQGAKIRRPFPELHPIGLRISVFNSPDFSEQDNVHLDDLGDGIRIN